MFFINDKRLLNNLIMTSDLISFKAFRMIEIFTLMLMLWLCIEYFDKAFALVYQNTS